ncbi:hypothetical protein GDO86_016545 [Hymenochirus boettgeri]|nr:hypothetical protein GDO86_016545 [Hymenochirus boettgeri]
MNLPPPQGGTGMNPQSPQGCTGMNLPSPQGRLVMSLPSPQSGMGMNLPSPQGGIGMNRPSPKGGMGMNLPPPQGSSQGLSLPQSSSGMNHPPPQDNPGMNQTPPPCTSSMNLPLPQGGSGHNYPPPISGHGMNLRPLHVSPGLSLPPPQGGLSLNITPPQLSPTSATGMECRLPVPPLGYGMNLPPPSMENVGSTKPKKRSEPVKISVPELHTAGSDSEEDEPTVKKSVMQGSREGLGLSSLLPQPKNASSSDSKRQFLPYIFTKKASDSVGGIKVPKSTSVAKPKLSLKSEVSLTPSPSAIKAAAKNAALQVTKQITQEEDDESDEDLQHGNYFSLSDTNETPAVVNENFSYSVPSDDEIAPPGVETPNDAANAPLDFKTTAGTINNQNWSTPTGEVYNSQQFSQYPEYGNPSDATYYQEYYNSAYYQEPDQSSTAEHREIATPDSFMDDEAFKRLQGKRNRGREEINFVDIKGDDQLSSNQQWLTKSLTEEKTMKSFSKRKGEQPTGQQRRKHQITYLIHQAKERELELKNTWSENKMSRRQTQAKYGF